MTRPPLWARRNNIALGAWNLLNRPRASTFGNFLLQAEDMSYRFEASFDDEAPLPTDDSYGGWAVVDIPKRLGQLEWSGRHPMGLEINFLIDTTNAAPEADSGRYCGRMFDQMEKMAGLHAMDEEPPLLMFQSNGICPHDFSQNRNWRWVIEALAWDRARFINNLVGRPIFIAGTVTLRQFNSEELMEAYKGPARRNRDRNKKKRSGSSNLQRYEVKPGDTLHRIAARKLGGAGNWTEIAVLNDIRHPRDDLKVGDVLLLPPKR